MKNGNQPLKIIIKNYNSCLFSLALQGTFLLMWKKRKEIHMFDLKNVVKINSLFTFTFTFVVLYGNQENSGNVQPGRQASLMFFNLIFM